MPDLLGYILATQMHLELDEVNLPFIVQALSCKFNSSFDLFSLWFSTRMRSSSFYQPPFPSPPPPPVPYFSSTSLTSCPELDLSITLSSVHTVEPCSPKKTHQIDQSGHNLKLCPRAQAENNGNTQVISYFHIL